MTLELLTTLAAITLAPSVAARDGEPTNEAVCVSLEDV